MSAGRTVLTVLNCRFLNNTARKGEVTGSAILAYASTLLLSNTTFSSNIGGAAVYHNNGDDYQDKHCNIINCQFNNNSGGDGGGALHLNVLAANITSCQFKNNSAKSGGALYAEGTEGDPHSAVKLTDTTFIFNEALYYGGACNILYAW